jgi:hypothetical protein
MDCKTARVLLEFARPHELDAAEAQALDSHLASCGECDALARAERQLDEQFGRAVRQVALPAGLRERIVGQLQQERNIGRSRRVAWTRRIAAVAAALLLAALVGYLLYPSEPPDLRVDELQNRAFLQRGANRERVQEWLSEQRGNLAAPAQFNYALLAYYGLEEQQKQRIPMLVFVNGRDRALVYIISGKQFNLDALVRDRPASSGGQSVAILADGEHPDIAYVVIYTGESLQPFLTESSRSFAG